ncbi:SAM-dependent methyltransferase [Caulobacter sp. FWC2]|nr:SAM-dependent methyltransferase [Caulobacter sp. FWC2]
MAPWARRALRSPEAAGYALLRLSGESRLMQDDATTGLDRYPTIFAFTKASLPGAQALLSFGCATGEEVFTLRRYFSEAHLLGLDIHPGNVARCRRRLAAAPDPAIVFRRAGDTRALATASMDAIFCLAVMRRGDLNAHPGAPRCDGILRFDRFAAQIEDFARVLRPGGLLAVNHSNFRLCDTPAARLFAPRLVLPATPDPRTPLFGTDHSRLADQAYGETVFERL